MFVRSGEIRSARRLSPKEEYLTRITMFAGLGDAELAALAERAVEKRFAPGETLFFEGDPCSGLYVLAEGTVKIYKTSPSGREVMLALIPAPSSVAEVPLFDGDPYPASCVATDQVLTLFLDQREFHQICRQFPEVAMQSLRVVGRRLRQLVSTIERISFGSVRQRLAVQLLKMGEQAGTDVFPLPVTHQEIASRLGTVREVITRNLGRFQAEGLVQIAGREIRLLDKEGLRREAETEL